MIVLPVFMLAVSIHFAPSSAPPVSSIVAQDDDSAPTLDITERNIDLARRGESLHDAIHAALRDWLRSRSVANLRRLKRLLRASGELVVAFNTFPENTPYTEIEESQTRAFVANTRIDFDRYALESAIGKCPANAITSHLQASALSSDEIQLGLAPEDDQPTPASALERRALSAEQFCRPNLDEIGMAWNARELARKAVSYVPRPSRSRPTPTITPQTIATGLEQSPTPIVQPFHIVGGWSGSINDEYAGQGTMNLYIQNLNSSESGSWNAQFSESRLNNGGRVEDAVVTSGEITFVIRSGLVGGGCSYTVHATVDGDGLHGTYSGLGRCSANGGSLDLNRR